MVDDLCPTKGGDMLRMAGDPWTMVCLSIKVIAQLRLIYNDEIHFCSYIDVLFMFGFGQSVLLTDQFLLVVDQYCHITYQSHFVLPRYADG